MPALRGLAGSGTLDRNAAVLAVRRLPHSNLRAADYRDGPIARRFG